jgi:hypothetical protein
MLLHEQQLEMLERLATEVIPVVRREAPTTLWTGQDPDGRRPAFTGRQVADAVAIIDSPTPTTSRSTPAASTSGTARQTFTLRVRSAASRQPPPVLLGT